MNVLQFSGYLGCIFIFLYGCHLLHQSKLDGEANRRFLKNLRKLPDPPGE